LANSNAHNSCSDVATGVGGLELPLVVNVTSYLVTFIRILQNYKPARQHKW